MSFLSITFALSILFLALGLVLWERKPISLALLAMATVTGVMAVVAAKLD